MGKDRYLTFDNSIFWLKERVPGMDYSIILSSGVDPELSAAIAGLIAEDIEAFEDNFEREYFN